MNCPRCGVEVIVKIVWLKKRRWFRPDILQDKCPKCWLVLREYFDRIGDDT